MIQRIVMFRLKEEHRNEAAREAFAERTRNDLDALSQTRGVTVGVPADDKTAASWDIVITVLFDSMEDVHAYIPDPDHRKYVEGYAMPKIEARKAWNVEI